MSLYNDVHFLNCEYKKKIHTHFNSFEDVKDIYDTREEIQP